MPRSLPPIILSSGAGQGVNGFAAPNLLTAADVAAAPSNAGPNGNAWSTTPAGSFLPESSAQYVGYRLPDFQQSATDFVPADPTTGAAAYWETTQNHIPIPSNWEDDLADFPNYNYLYVTTIDPFQYDLEYQNASGEWVPYNYASGVNDSANTWAGASIYSPYLQGCKTIPGATYHDPPMFSPLETTFSGTGVALTSDPRSVRFGLWQFLRNSSTEAAFALIRSLWDNLAITAAFLNYGYGGGQHSAGITDGPSPIDAANVPPRFMGIPAQSSYYPAQLVRNNQANGAASSTPITGYVDNDGIQRIADSGLFVGSSSANLNPSTGNPFQRVADQPVVLNRPFNSVAEMGYAFRDDPWHSLDFFSAASADSGLLDLFSLHEGTDGDHARDSRRRGPTRFEYAKSNGSGGHAGGNFNRSMITRPPFRQRTR